MVCLPATRMLEIHKLDKSHAYISINKLCGTGQVTYHLCGIFLISNVIMSYHQPITKILLVAYLN